MTIFYARGCWDLAGRSCVWVKRCENPNTGRADYPIFEGEERLFRMQLKIGVDLGWLLNGCFCSIHLEFKYRSLDRGTEYSWRCS